MTAISETKERLCPKCKIALSPSLYHSAFSVCKKCLGRAALFKETDTIPFEHENLLAALRIFRHRENRGMRQCPYCNSEMWQLELREGHYPLIIDHCDLCNGFWFDSGEYQDFLSKEARIRSVEHFKARLLDAPLICMGALALGFVSMVGVARNPKYFHIFSFSYDPDHIFHFFQLGLISSFFLPGSSRDLMSSWFYLALLGVYLEYWIGKRALLSLLVISQLASILVFTAMNYTESFTLIGASGAVFGVMSFYLFHMLRTGLVNILRSRNKFIGVLIAITFQFLYIFAFTGEGVRSSTYWGHLGGGLGGILYFLYWRKGARPVESDENLLVAAFEKVLHGNQIGLEAVAKTIQNQNLK